MITFIRTTKDFIFGGYTPIAWNSSDKFRKDSSQKNFIFTIKNSPEFSSRQFTFEAEELQYEIYTYSSQGPIFDQSQAFMCVSLQIM
jgi:predicted NAD/FAD-dependent oxidoreductase